MGEMPEENWPAGACKKKKKHHRKRLTINFCHRIALTDDVHL